MLGCASTGKGYIGQDARMESVVESNTIIDYFGLANCAVQQSDATNYSGQHSALFTCPPYGNAEIYIEGQIARSCDDWIDMCIAQHPSDEYLFVVNTTDKYGDFVVEELKYSSHFRKNSEYVIYLKPSDLR